MYVEPFCWITPESKRRLCDGGNAKGVVPVHIRRSHVATIPLYETRRAEAKLPDDNAEIYTALVDLYNLYSGQKKSCGHDFFCVCPGANALKIINRYAPDGVE